MPLQTWRTSSFITTVVVTSLLVKQTWAEKPEELIYFEDGDLILGVLTSVIEPSKVKDALCGKKVRQMSSVLDAGSIIYAVEQVNKQNTDLLHGLRLGVAILDTCSNPSLTILQSSRFIPASKFCLRPGAISVIGVIQCLWSSRIISVSTTLKPYSIPILSYMDTDSSLSNKMLHPHFFRLVPHNKYLTHALLEFVNFLGWKEVSIVHSISWYGKDGYHELKKRAEILNICLDLIQEINEFRADKFVYRRVVQALLTDNAARVVIVVALFPSYQGLMNAAQELNATGQIVWIGSEGWTRTLLFQHQVDRFVPGVFIISLQSFELTEYSQYVKNMNVLQSKNPWLIRAFQDIYNCSKSTCNFTQILTEIKDMHFTSYAYDTVLTFAYGLDALIKNKCFYAWGGNAKQCMLNNREHYSQFIKKVHFQGKTDIVTFNHNGDRLTKVSIYQDVSSHGDIRAILLAEYDIKNQHLIQFKEPDWTAFHGQKRPESTCTRKCMPGSIKKPSGCCWICHPCKNNEITVEETQRCLPCPELEWPSYLYNFTQCAPIKPLYLNKDDLSVSILLFSAAIGILLSLAVSVLYISRRQNFVIKASSWELSLVQQIAIFMGYCAVAMLLQRPTDHICIFAFALVNISFNSLYVASLLKAIRVYRIFEAGSAGRNMRFTSGLSQLTAIAVYLSFEITWFFVYQISSPIRAVLMQSDKQIPLVKLSCEIPNSNMKLFLTTNLTLLVLCSTFAFKTRNVPKRFSESRHVSLCIITTMLTWIIFMPVYSAPQDLDTKMLMLCSVILINTILTTGFLFLPKVLTFLDKSDSRVGRSITISLRKFLVRKDDFQVTNSP